MKDLTEQQMKAVRRLAGGKLSSPRKIQEAAHRMVIGFNDEYDVELVTQYIESLE